MQPQDDFFVAIIAAFTIVGTLLISIFVVPAIFFASVANVGIESVGIGIGTILAVLFVLQIMFSLPGLAKNYNGTSDRRLAERRMGLERRRNGRRDDPDRRQDERRRTA